MENWVQVVGLLRAYCSNPLVLHLNAIGRRVLSDIVDYNSVNDVKLF